MKKTLPIIIAIAVVLLTAIAAALLSGCSDLVPGVWDDPDFIYHHPPDTTATTPTDTIGGNQDTITNPIILPPDTCHQLIHLSDTAFVCLSTAFDVPPLILGYHWYGNNSNITFLTLQGLMETYWPQYHYTYYENSKGLAVFIDGTDNSTQFNGLIGVETTNETWRLKTANKYAITDYGALTFEQECFEADRRLNIKFYTLSNTDFTQAQNDIIIRKRNHFADCKAAEKFADFSYKQISQSVRDSTLLYGWEVRH